MTLRHAHTATAGARWVDRYLVPRISEHMNGRTLKGVRILQLDPDDTTEATRCAELGASVTLGVCGQSRIDTDSFARVALTPDAPIDASDDAFDLILTGHPRRLSAAWSSTEAFLGECSRVCAPSGGMMVPLATRCPLDLSGDAVRAAPRLTVRDLERAFGSVRLLPVRGHFGWSSGGPARRVVGRALDVWWRWCATPAHPRVYTSALNPVMLVWASNAGP